ncbi:asparagine synthetase B [Salmonella enterica subsp. arizonae]|uniref:Asparagine synthetase B n=1 Tax=Salmonella enterica subsp. arizonae TaxID=59203 RepID=A0A379TH25_SALER|nr:asparagine synthetase B [Salmonella enterica subsp. arizonae]
MEKHVLRECFESYLPASVAWRQKEQFSDRCGLQLDRYTKKKSRQNRFPINNWKPHVSASHTTRPSSKEAYLYREIFEELFPVPSAGGVRTGRPSVACSSAKAIEWDEAFKTMDDPSGRRGRRASVGHTSK